MNNVFKDNYSRLLDKVGQIDGRYSDFHMDTFWPMVGVEYSGKLLVVGRAVNGWELCKVGWTPNDFRNIKNDILVKTIEASEKGDKCPMLWVKDGWGLEKVDADGRRQYNSRRSAFWRVIKGVVYDLSISTNNDWPSYIAWTNLYKVSRHGYGNPPSWLCKAQKELCLELIASELEFLKPEMVLFLTGEDWAESFLDRLGLTDDISMASSSFNERHGLIRIPNVQRQARVVVVPHPQGKPEGRMKEEIIRSFKQLAIISKS